jgi:hypothetical protein
MSSEVRHEGLGLVYLEEHRLLAYVGKLTRTVVRSWALGSDSFCLFDPQPWGNDWDSPLIRQVRLELLDGKDPLRFCTGPVEGRPSPQRLHTLSIDPLDGPNELRYRGPAIVLGPLQDERYRWYYQFNVRSILIFN